MSQTSLRRRGLRFLARAALFLAVVLGVHWVAYTVVPDNPPILPARSASALVACPTEDSTNCFWAGDSQGNGLGKDLWN